MGGIVGLCCHLAGAASALSHKADAKSAGANGQPVEQTIQTAEATTPYELLEVYLSGTRRTLAATWIQQLLGIYGRKHVIHKYLL